MRHRARATSFEDAVVCSVLWQIQYGKLRWEPKRHARLVSSKSAKRSENGRIQETLPARGEERRDDVLAALDSIRPIQEGKEQNI